VFKVAIYDDSRRNKIRQGFTDEENKRVLENDLTALAG
jgi:hypothetical protein